MTELASGWGVTHKTTVGDRGRSYLSVQAAFRQRGTS